jgi:hypothetical protein
MSVPNPLPSNHSPDVANGGSGGYIGDMDRRLTVLETRFDTILPTLATKADLAAFKAEILEMLAGTNRWLIGIMVVMIMGFGGMFVTLTNAPKQAPPQVQPIQLPPIIINIPPTPAPTPAAR